MFEKQVLQSVIIGKHIVMQQATDSNSANPAEMLPALKNINKLFTMILYELHTLFKNST